MSIKYTSSDTNLEVTFLHCLCVKGFPFVIIFAERGFHEVADWLEFQYSLKRCLGK